MTEPGQKMSLLEAYAELKPMVKPPCPFGKIVETLDPSDQRVLADWMADASMSSSKIAMLLTRAGHTIHRNTVTEHRKELCRCGR